MGLFVEARLRHVGLVTRREADGSMTLACLEGPEGARLPAFEMDERHPAAVEHVIDAVREQLGVETFVLRCVAMTEAPPEGASLGAELASRYIALETTGRATKRCSREELLRAPLANPHDQMIALAWLEEAASPDPPPDCRGWTRLGWFEETSRWIHDVVRARVGDVEVVIAEERTWEFSCVLRVTAGDEAFFLKALPRSLLREAAIVPVLARRGSPYVPEVLAFDAAQGFLLSRACPGKTLEGERDLSRWVRAIEAYADLQISWNRQTDELTEAGLPVRPLAQLAAEIEPLLLDEASMLAGDPDGVSLAQAAALRAKLPALRALAEEAARTSTLGDTLEHGDLWASNVLVDAREVHFIDWTDACVTHPFFGLLLFLRGPHIKKCVEARPDAVAVLRAAYLARWAAAGAAGAAGARGLEGELACIESLAPLYHASVYRRNVVPMVAAGREMREMVAYFLKMLVPEISGKPSAPSASA